MGDLRAIYCHIPFCHSICPFCAFAIHGNQEYLHDPFLEALETELSLRRGITAPHPMEALYIGGGTPSTLSVNRVARLLKSIRGVFQLAKNCQIAFELNPEDATPPYLTGLHGLGINRVSLGLQSFSGETLALLGRKHSPEQAHQALRSVSESSIGNFNVDLMFGIPGDQPGRLMGDLDHALTYQPHHISLYGLDVEPGTLFARNPIMSDGVTERMEETALEYETAVKFLSNHGYEQYETSNFCLPGREGRQNLLVWDGASYLGFGPGAHSYINGTRSFNHRHLRAYIRALQNGALPIAGSETLTPEQKANEQLLVNLRRNAGLNLDIWAKESGQPWGEGRQMIVVEMVARGLAVLEGGILHLTPRGMMLGDEITARLMM